MKSKRWSILAASYLALTIRLPLLVSALERRLPVRGVGHG